MANNRGLRLVNPDENHIGPPDSPPRLMRGDAIPQRPPLIPLPVIPEDLKGMSVEERMKYIRFAIRVRDGTQQDKTNFTNFTKEMETKYKQIGGRKPTHKKRRSIRRKTMKKKDLKKKGSTKYKRGTTHKKRRSSRTNMK